MIFETKAVNYSDRIGELETDAVGIVKSHKIFPKFVDDNGEEKLFKPLSSTKPFCTPLFGYSEVYWSNLINGFIDEKAPIYELAICHDMPNKYGEIVSKQRGTLVNSYLDDGQKSMNLLEYYLEHPDIKVDIENYENFCGVYYDYSKILDSDIFNRRHDLSQKLAEQVLTSTLTRNSNFHYENVAFIYKDNKIVDLAPMIDHEFSLMFSNQNQNKDEWCSDDTFFDVAIGYFNLKHSGNNFRAYGGYNNLLKNISVIKEKHPEVVKGYLEKLANMKEHLSKNDIILLNDGYIEPYSDYEWMVERYRRPDNYNQKMIDKGEMYLKKYGRSEINIADFSTQTNRMALKSLKALENALK